MRQYLALFTSLFFCFISLSQAEEPLVTAFGSLPDVKTMKISPSGAKLAFLQRNKDSYALVMQSLTENQEKPIVFAVNEGEIRDLRWVADERVMLTITVPYHYAPAQMWYTFFRTALVNTINGEALFPFSSERYRYNTNGMRLEHTLPADAAHVYVSNTYRANLEAPRSEGLFKLNVLTGDTELIESVFMPNSNGASWIFDDTGDFLGYQQYSDNAERWETYWKQSDGSGYNQVQYFPEKEFGIPRILAVNGETAYVRWTTSNGVWGLYATPKEDLQAKRNVLLRFAEHDLDNDFYQDLHTGKLLGATVVRDVFEQHFVFDDELAGIYRSLQATFEQAQVEILSYSRNRQLLTVVVSGTGLGPTYYLYDRGAGEIALLGEEYPLLAERQPTQTEPFTFTATDGLTIPGYLTLPNVSDTKPELIVLPHGGPHSRDNADFNWIRDFFVANGYAVYQPNFRGSSGYGYKFLNAGYGQWGRRMQQDVYEGTQAVLASGRVAQRKPCIIGHSYGGYVALLAAVEAQAQFRCAISSAGVSNMKQLLDEETILFSDNDGWERNKHAQQYFAGEITSSNLTAISPHERADKNTLPLLMFHGKRDTVVRYKHSERMYAKLRDSGNKGAVLLPANGSDHWFTQAQTRKVFLSDSLYFIQTR
ncbi:alpha/beta hydrolase family protein [Alteromonas flava]|uniref:alpha/beta hydrolase family protein n=1 Tax=Alteromonas flava TaxID=2048003 RepID=UPI000C289C46|nr:alpha/beta fold hydrolase [Alteromonas flava]